MNKPTERNIRTILIFIIALTLGLTIFLLIDVYEEELEKFEFEKQPETFSENKVIVYKNIDCLFKIGDTLFYHEDCE